MTDWLFVLLTFAVGFLVGALVGYRRGVADGAKKQQ